MQILIIAQIIVSVVLIALILLQQRGTALGSVFGGEGGYYGTRRGAEKNIFWATVVFGAAFILLAALNLIF
jgi:preprotein translocase subunit SecG